MHGLAKFALVSTSLAPVFIAYALSYAITTPPEWWKVGVFVAVALSTVVLAKWILGKAARDIPSTSFPVKTIQSHDKELLAFLLAYLLPLTSGESLSFKHPVVAIYVLALLLLSVHHSNAFHFNPVLSLLRYRFYEATDDKGRKVILLTRKSYSVAPHDPVSVIILSENVYMEVDTPSPPRAD